MDIDIAVSCFSKHCLAAREAAFDRDTALVGLRRDVGAGLHRAIDLHITVSRAGRSTAGIGDELAVNRDSAIAGLGCGVLGRVHLATDRHIAALRLDHGVARLRVDFALDLDVAILAQCFSIAALGCEQIALDGDISRLSRLEHRTLLGRDKTVNHNRATGRRQRCRRAGLDRAVLLRRADGNRAIFRRSRNGLACLQRAVDCNRAVVRRHLDIRRGIDCTSHVNVALVRELLAVRCREHRVAILRSQRTVGGHIALRSFRRDKRTACDIACNRDAAIRGLCCRGSAALDITVKRDIAIRGFDKRCFVAGQSAADSNTAIRRLGRDVGASLHQAADVHIAVLRLDRGFARLRLDPALDLDVAILTQCLGVAILGCEQVSLDRDVAELRRLEFCTMLGRDQTMDRNRPTGRRQRCHRASVDLAVLLRRADGNRAIFCRSRNGLVSCQRAIDRDIAMVRCHPDVDRGIDCTRHADVALVPNLLAVGCREHCVAILRSQRTVDGHIAFRSFRRYRSAALDIAHDRDTAIRGLCRRGSAALDITVNRDIAIGCLDKRCLATGQIVFDRDIAVIGLGCDVSTGLYWASDLYITVCRVNRSIACISINLAIHRDSTAAGINRNVGASMHLAFDRYITILRLERCRTGLRIDLALDLDVAILTQCFDIATLGCEQVALDRDCARLRRLEFCTVLGRYRTVNSDRSIRRLQGRRCAGCNRTRFILRANRNSTVLVLDYCSCIALDITRYDEVAVLLVGHRDAAASHGTALLVKSLLGCQTDCTIRSSKISAIRQHRAGVHCEISTGRYGLVVGHTAAGSQPYILASRYGALIMQVGLCIHDHVAAFGFYIAFVGHALGGVQDDVFASQAVFIRQRPGCIFMELAAANGQGARGSQVGLVVDQADAFRSRHRSVDSQVVHHTVLVVADGDILGLAARGEGYRQVFIAAVAEHDIRCIAGILQRHILECIELLGFRLYPAVQADACRCVHGSRLRLDGMGCQLTDGTTGIKVQRIGIECAVFQIDFPVTGQIHRICLNLAHKHRRFFIIPKAQAGFSRHSNRMARTRFHRAKQEKTILFPDLALAG